MSESEPARVRQEMLVGVSDSNNGPVNGSSRFVNGQVNSVTCFYMKRAK